MGQSLSTAAAQPPVESLSARFALHFPLVQPRDFTSDIPDECLSHVFHFLDEGDRKRCSLVCHRWLKLEGESRTRLTLDARSELVSFLPVLFARFDSVTKLVLRCDRSSVSISDDALVMIAENCVRLTRLKLRHCREITDEGIARFAERCRGLKKLSCSSCTFGVKGLNAVLGYCTGLEELSLKRFKGVYNNNNNHNNNNNSGDVVDFVGVKSMSLRLLCLKDLFVNPRTFESLIFGSEKLRSLKVIRCLGDWDRIFKVVGMNNRELVEVHLEKLQLSDAAVSGLSNCGKLEVLHLLKTSHCSDFGVASVAERCRLLRKLHIDGFRAGRIGDEGLVAVAKHCGELQELVLIGVNVTHLSLMVIGNGCRKLERLALCRSETIGDVEMMCIADKCAALRKLCVKACPISDAGIEALAVGCPSLVKVKVKKCKGVSNEVAEFLRVRRGSLALNLDYESEFVDASGSDNGGQEIVENMPNDVALTANFSRMTLLRTKLGLFASRNLVSCAFRRWYNSDEGVSGNS